MHVTETIRYVGVNDHHIDLFEGQYVVPNGMAYNSYLILDDKVAVMDSVDKNFTDEWLGNIRAEFGHAAYILPDVQNHRPGLCFQQLFPDFL